MEYLRIILIGLAILFIALLLKTRLWRRIPVVSSIISLLLFIGAVALALFFGSIIIVVILCMIGVAIILFLAFWIFGRARFYRISGKEFILKNKKPNKKPKVKVLK